MPRRSRVRPRRFRKETIYLKREGFLLLTFVLAAGAIFLRTGELALMRGPALRAFAFSQQEFFKVVTPPRGNVYLEKPEGELLALATNVSVNLLAASPQEIPRPEEYARLLAPILGLAPDELEKRLSKRNDLFEVLKEELSKEEVAKVSALDLKGLAIIPTTKRVYPQSTLGAHLVGFVGESEEGMRGQYGLERFYESRLAGKAGFLSGLKNAKGYIVSASSGSLPEEEGEDLILTVDPAVQYRLEQVLSRGMERWQAAAASGLVLDPKSGRIIAAAALPTFDPNHYREVGDLSRFLNPLASLQFEPGSIMKPITFAAALDLGLISASTTYEDVGRVEVGGWVIENADPKPNGRQTMRQVLEKSINTGAVFVAQKIGMDKFRDYLSRFGFGEKTGIDLPAEVPGDIRNLSSGRPVNLATASFGQGIATTPLQIAAAFGAIANDGNLMRPFVVERIGREGERAEEQGPELVRQVIQPGTSRGLSELMVSVVDNGFGRPAGVPGYSIAGKTGTAQIPSPGGGYTNETIHTFAGFGPASNPRFVVFIRLDKPHGTNFSSSTAAPMFREMAEFLLRYYQIPPDRPVVSKQ